MKQAEEDCAGHFFSTVTLGAFWLCLGWLCFQYLFLPWAADDGLGIFNFGRNVFR